MSGQTRPPVDEGNQAQLLKGIAELGLLSLLSEREHYGLEILARLREEAGLAVAEGTIYPLLHRLQRAGLTRADWRVVAGTSRPRKYYALSAAGRRELASMEAQWRELAAGLNVFLDRDRKP